MVAAGLGESTPQRLCHRFIAGLKPELRIIHELYALDHDLQALQARAIEIDEIKWSNRAANGTKGTTSRPFQQAHQYTGSGAVPMEIDSAEVRYTKLTDAEKAEYRAKGWCTFCRAHDHTFAQCRHPNRKHRPTRALNNVDAGTNDGTAETSTTEDRQ